jgi:hypothetical protein
MVEKLNVFWCASVLVGDVEGSTVKYYIKFDVP